jgi:RimJ/RimL family protein N-acetyltransferase
MLKIEGERIYLRDHQATDLDVFHTWLSDPNVAHYLSWRSSTLEESFIQLAAALQENHREPRIKYFFAIILKANNCIIGDAGFTVAARAEDGGIADLGYFLLKPYWGKGYATEATQVLIAYCFTTLNLHKVIASCDSDNLASEHVMKKCGMEREAYRQKHLRLNGEWRDRLEYALLYDDWKKRQGS